MKKAAIIILTLASLLLCSCQDDRFITAFTGKDGIYLSVNSKTVFEYDPLTCQLSFNRERCEFRVHTDNMSDFYVLTLSEIPTRQGQDVRGTLVWTTEMDLNTKKNVTFTAEKLEGDRIWLWTGNGRVGVVVQILD